MKVKPVVKRQQIKENEMRVINVGKDAICELLFEHLMEHQDEHFAYTLNHEIITCMMNWDAENGVLTYAAARLAETMRKDFDLEKVRKEVGLTTDTLFRDHRFISVPLSDYIIEKK